MKNNFYKHLFSIVFALGLIGTCQAWAKDKSHDSNSFRGIFLQGNGDNFADPNLPNEVNCPLFDEHGKHVGYVHSELFSDSARHTFRMKDKSCFSQYISGDIVFTTTSPITDSVVAAFPELAPYLGNEDALVLIADSNQSKDGPGIYSWKNCGPKGSIFHDKVTSLTVRCVFLILNGRTEKCIGCSYAFR